MSTCNNLNMGLRSGGADVFWGCHSFRERAGAFYIRLLAQICLFSVVFWCFEGNMCLLSPFYIYHYWNGIVKQWRPIWLAPQSVLCHSVWAHPILQAHKSLGDFHRPVWEPSDRLAPCAPLRRTAQNILTPPPCLARFRFFLDDYTNLSHECLWTWGDTLCPSEAYSKFWSHASRGHLPSTPQRKQYVTKEYRL